MKIIHIINSLKKGGAEGNLYRLTKFHKKKYKNKIDIIIVTLINNGFYEIELKKYGVKIFSLNVKQKNNFLDYIRIILKLRTFIKKHKPNVIQSWMYHSNFLTIFIQRIYHNKIFWNIRHTILNPKMSKKTTILISKICALFSKHVPKKIIYCSRKSIEFHENQHFYFKNKTVLIDNGYSDKVYYPSKIKRLDFRKKNKIKRSDIILGFAGRYDKQKNIRSLLFAFSRIIKSYKNIYLYMVGKNINNKNKDLMKYVKDFQVEDKVFLLNEQKNLIKFYNGIDLLLLTSHSESFPNVVAESMLCSTPVLSSNVGSSKKIIGDCGFIMKKNNHNSIFNNLRKLVNFYQYKKKEWKFLKKKSQLRIRKNFSIEKMANKYFENWNLK